MSAIAHNTKSEHARLEAHLDMIQSGKFVLEAGARDGFLAVALRDRFEDVTALDLVAPQIADSSVGVLGQAGA